MTTMTGTDWFWVIVLASIAGILTALANHTDSVVIGMAMGIVVGTAYTVGKRNGRAES